MKTINPKRLSEAFEYIKKRALSDACGVPPSNVSKWFSGDNIPRKHYETIVRVSGKSLTWLCGGERCQ